MTGRVAICRRHHSRMTPRPEAGWYHCWDCAKRVHEEELDAARADTLAVHVFLFERETDTRWSAQEARKALRGAVSVPDGEAGALALVPESS